MIINCYSAAPGGPIEQIIAEVAEPMLEPQDALAAVAPKYRAGHLRIQLEALPPIIDIAERGLDPEFIKELERQFGFDKPLHERFIDMMGNFITFDFGKASFAMKR